MIPSKHICSHGWEAVRGQPSISSCSGLHGQAWCQRRCCFPETQVPAVWTRVNVS